MSRAKKENIKNNFGVLMGWEKKENWKVKKMKKSNDFTNMFQEKFHIKTSLEKTVDTGFPVWW